MDGFDVAMVEEAGYRVAFKAAAGDGTGRLWPVTHVFRDISQEELLEFERKLPRTELRRNKLITKGSAMKAKLDLWAKLIKKVEGYVYKGRDLVELSDWKAKVPPQHRVQAIDSMYEMIVPDEEEEDLAPFGEPSEDGSSGDTHETGAPE